MQSLVNDTNFNGDEIYIHSTKTMEPPTHIEWGEKVLHIHFSAFTYGENVFFDFKAKFLFDVSINEHMFLPYLLDCICNIYTRSSDKYAPASKGEKWFLVIYENAQDEKQKYIPITISECKDRAENVKRKFMLMTCFKKKKMKGLSK